MSWSWVVGGGRGSVTDGKDIHHKITLNASLSILLAITTTCPSPSETFAYAIKVDCLACVEIMLFSLRLRDIHVLISSLTFVAHALFLHAKMRGTVWSKTKKC